MADKSATVILCWLGFNFLWYDITGFYHQHYCLFLGASVCALHLSLWSLPGSDLAQWSDLPDQSRVVFELQRKIRHRCHVCANGILFSNTWFDGQWISISKRLTYAISG